MPYSGMDQINAYLDLDTETIMKIASEIDEEPNLPPAPAKQNGGRRKVHRYDASLFQRAVGFADALLTEFNSVAYDERLDIITSGLSAPVKTKGYRRLLVNGETAASLYMNANGTLRAVLVAKGKNRGTVTVKHEADIHEVAVKIVSLVQETALAKTKT